MNGLGRILWGILADKIGWVNAIVIMQVAFGLAMLSIEWAADAEHSQTSIITSVTFIGLCFGGNFTLYAPLTAMLFGDKSIASNYTTIFLAFGIGGIVGPILGGVLSESKQYNLPFRIAGALCFVAAVEIFTLEPPPVPSKN
eukprot:CAMPEP_0185787284 /NCGR_PEP_ID=MMETSP1174-20130828/139750_1 /TAXON_ID=35687 /ORGANISM="Dictyocha speculum, Strain CCMP1381" /LENGTH=141 /DNA_ID=CAMNT_0028480341 /DNA_START=14 /DNA_END=439 /DNA_ORIENTATION=-